MSYKPKTLKSDFVRGTTGVASVAVSPDGKKFKITFKDSEDSFIIPSENCPKEMRKGTWFISMSSDEKKVIGIRPANGIFTAKVDHFIANEGEDPTPRTKVGNDWTYQYFLVLLSLLSEKVTGMNVPAILRYNFGEADEDGKSVVAFTHPKSKYTPLLVEFCDVTGVWSRGAMQFKDNILPIMEKRILREDKKFQVVIKNGYVDSFLELDNPDEEEIPSAEEVEEREEKASKKSPVDEEAIEEDEEKSEPAKKRGRPPKTSKSTESDDEG